jgi:putative aldouronate transport system permease protein
VSGTVISFENFRFVGATTFAGLKNFQDVFTSYGFWQAFVNTLLLSCGNVILTAAVPMVIALSLNEVIRTPWKRFVQSIIYTPYLFSWVVVGGIWIFLLAPGGGLINGILGLFGVKPIYFMVQENLARPILIAVNLWKQMGYVCIIYLASVSGINPELYEAAMIDGAGGFKRAVYITIPELVATLKIVLLLNVMGALRIFDQVYVMRNDVIAPKIDVLMYYVYVEGLNQFRIGYAAAVSVFIFLVTLVITLLTRHFARYRI